MDMRILKCTINGKPVQVGYDPRESLLDTLRTRAAQNTEEAAALLRRAD